MLSIGIWSQKLEPGKRARVLPMTDFRITAATLGETLADETGRTTIKMYRAKHDDDEDSDDEDDEDRNYEFEDEPIILTSLIAGKIETQVLDLVFVDDEPVEFEISGKNTVHLIGNYIDQMPLAGPGLHDSDDDDSEEEDYELDEVSSDVEIDPQDMMVDAGSEDESDQDDSARFQEIVENELAELEQKKAQKTKKGKESKKRARESDAVSDDGAEKEAEEQPPLTKSQKKKLNKKLKAEGGVAVPTGEPEKTKANAPAAKDKEGKKEEKKEKKEVRRTFKTPGGAEVIATKEGSGPQAQNGNTLEMRYIGKLPDGKVFDKNVSGKAFKFVLGKGEVIKGWDEGLLGMRVGGERIVNIPPSLGYGKRKMGDIPPNSTLRFEVKLLNIK